MKKSDILKVVVLVVIISFLGMIIASTNGYYEGELEQKTILTNEAIDQFEKDVKAGKKIDINNYLENTTRDYDNRFSNTGRYISKKIEDVITTGAKKIFSFIDRAVNTSFILPFLPYLLYNYI